MLVLVVYVLTSYFKLFTVPDGRQAYQWLTNGYTVWAIGTVGADGRFTNKTEGSFDEGAMFCQQSFWTPDKRRVSIGWIRSAPATQSLGREIVAVGDALHYRPIKELASLHGPIAFNQTGVKLSATAVQLGSGTQFRVTASVTCPTKDGRGTATNDATGGATGDATGDATEDAACSATVDVLGGALGVGVSQQTAGCAGKGSSASKPYSWCLIAGGKQLPFGDVGSGVALLDIFVDGAVVEVYAGNGERVLTLDSSKANSDANSMSGNNGAVANVQAWPLGLSL